MRYLLSITLACVLGAGLAGAQEEVSTELVAVVAGPLEKVVRLPGQLAAYQKVDVHARVSGFVAEVKVDRGSRVKAGDLLARMTAPELEARRAEVAAAMPAIEAERAEAEAHLAGVEGTLARLREAAKTPGAVAGNDVVLAEKEYDAERSRVEAIQRRADAVEAAVNAVKELEKYLRMTAPFDGTITARFAHTGSLAGPEGGGREPLFTIEQMDRLRLVAAVPEAHTESIRRGARAGFTVPAYPSVTFTGVVARPAHAVDSATRTMPVELDVDNAAGRLAPGMYCEISWPLRRRAESLFVPPSAIKTTTERVFVVRVREGKAEWVDVKRGLTQGERVEVYGELEAGDMVVLRATDEIRPGTAVRPR